MTSAKHHAAPQAKVYHHGCDRNGQITNPGLHTLALWNACSTVNALVALPFAASLPPAYLSPVPPVVLPLALVATKLVSAQAIKGLATSVGLTPAAWSLLDVIEADGGGDKGLAFAEGGDRHTP